MTTVLRGSQPNQGGSVDRLVECPLCKGLGCVVCHETGVVKQRNLDRAREPADDGWSEAALMRLWRMIVGPMRCRRERTREQRRYLEQNESPSRLDDLDRKHKHRRPE
jgi:hypothetical protein